MDRHVSRARARGCADVLELRDRVGLRVKRVRPNAVATEVRRVNESVVRAQVQAVAGRVGKIRRLADNALQSTIAVDRDGKAGAVGAPGHAPDGVGRGIGDNHVA